MRDHAAIIDLSAFASSMSPARPRWTWSSGWRCARWTCPRPGRVHAAADAYRRLSPGPDDHAPGRRHVPRRHRRRLRDVGPQVVHRAPPRGRLGAGPGPDQLLVHARLWGPRARDTLESVTSDDVSHEGFPFATVRDRGRQIPVLASRISYVGDLGWELYVPIEQGARLWDVLSRRAGRMGWAGGDRRVRRPPGGWRSAIAPTAPSSRASTTWSRPGWRGARSKTQTSSARRRTSAPREDLAAILCTLTVDDHTSDSGVTRYMLGHEPVLTRDGNRSPTPRAAAPSSPAPVRDPRSASTS